MSKTTIGNAKYYVTMTDKFMSGWGKAESKINKFVVGCDTFAEARIVEDNAKHREEMKNINITSNKPYYSPNRYLVSYVDKEEAENWFKEGYFNR
jgi:hypothetical protein